MPTTIQISRHCRSTYIKNVARGRTLEGLQACLSNVTKLGNWLELGKSLFDSVFENGGIWHLYGHSQEIEDLGLWKELEEILDYVAKRKGVTYLPNCKLIPNSCRQPSHHPERESVAYTPIRRSEKETMTTYEDTHCS
jgi:hypothetical protein